MGKGGRVWNRISTSKPYVAFVSEVRCTTAAEMRQARSEMPRRSFEEAWAQHDAAVVACMNFRMGNGVSMENSKREADSINEDRQAT